MVRHGNHLLIAGSQAYKQLLTTNPDLQNKCALHATIVPDLDVDALHKVVG